MDILTTIFEIARTPTVTGLPAGSFVILGAFAFGLVKAALIAR